MKNFVLRKIFVMILAAPLASAPFCAMADDYENEWEKVQSNTTNTKGNAAEPAPASVTDKRLNPEQYEEAEKLRTESAKGVRKFHEVLDELLAEFGYDVRMGQLKGLENVAIRKVEVSDSLPNSYRSYVELLISERIRENSQIRLVTCLPCKTKTSHVVEGKLMISSPTTNLADMRRAADQLGINHFMDIILVYHSTHMVLATTIFNTSTQDLVWARTYNSETIKSRYQKLAVDYKQVEKSRPGEDYIPEYRFLVGLGGAVIPNTSGDSDDSGMMAVVVRGTERFNNRKNEFGLHLSIFLAKGALTGGSSDSSEDTEASLAAGDGEEKTPDAFATAIGLYGIYAHNFIGSLESYNTTRHGASIGLGVVMAPPGYLAGSLRAGWDMFFGRRFAANLGLYYLMPAKVVVEEEAVDVKGGVGFELAMSVNI